jgi:catechol 2,3-dioxygenase-like lactoylglutathione lyase family enzyme
MAMLLDGFNHVAILTNDSARLHAFYEEVFDAEVSRTTPPPPPDAPPGLEVKLSFVYVGPNSELNVFEIEGNDEATRQTPMFGRGRIDHLALLAESIESFETIRERLVERGSSDGFVTDFGPFLSLFFRDPDGLECEVCVRNPDAVPGVFHPPGTPAPLYHGDG